MNPTVPLIDDSLRARMPHLLVVDPSATSRDWLKQLVEPLRYSVVEADSSVQGLRLAAEIRPAAIVLGGQMPGLDGLTFINLIKSDAVLRDTPCVFFTGSEEAGIELRAFEAGADLFARKGEDSALLLARLKTLVHSGDAVRTLSTAAQASSAPRNCSASAPTRAIYVSSGRSCSTKITKWRLRDPSRKRCNS